MKLRRLRKDAAHLEVTAFINLALPTQSTSALEQVKADNLQLEIVMHSDALEVGDRIGGLIQRIPATEKGPDIKTLQTLM